MHSSHVYQRLDQLGAISDEPGALTRLFCSPAMRRAQWTVASWMEQTGMTVRRDAIGNLIGRLQGNGPKTLLFGSHLDTVRNAGKYDGALGILLAIAAVDYARQWKQGLPFSIEVIAFAEEEGVRYQAAYLGSRAVAGTFDARDLERVDEHGISMAEAIRSAEGNPGHIESCRYNPDTLLGYIEAHIEQGPVLDTHHEPVGLVTAIAGQTRARLEFISKAGHAGTVPMPLRHDPLCAASEFIVGAEAFARSSPGLVATVGQIAVEPNAANVIPGSARLSLDLRHQNDSVRLDARERLKAFQRSIGENRKVQVGWETVQNTSAVPCAIGMTELLEKAANKFQPEIRRLASGAGHDAAIMAGIAPVAMLFVRCREGISHHPDEFVREEDVKIALAVLNDFIVLMADRSGHV